MTAQQMGRKARAQRLSQHGGTFHKHEPRLPGALDDGEDLRAIELPRDLLPENRSCAHRLHVAEISACPSRRIQPPDISAVL